MIIAKLVSAVGINGGGLLTQLQLGKLEPTTRRTSGYRMMS